MQFGEENEKEYRQSATFEERTKKQYKREVAKLPMLSTIETKNLFGMMNNGTCSAARRIQIRDEIINANLRLVQKRAGNPALNNRGLSYMDLVSEGNIGLMRAVDTHRGYSKYRFSTYAVNMIDNAMRNAIREKGEAIRIPVYVRSILNKYRYAKLDLLFENEQPVTEAAIQERTGLTDQQMHETRTSFFYYDSMQEENTDTGMPREEVTATPVPLAPTSAIDNKQEVNTYMDDLTEQEKRVIRLRYGLNDLPEHTLAEISELLGCSIQRVEYLEKRALRKMRRIAGWGNA